MTSTLPKAYYSRIHRCIAGGWQKVKRRDEEYVWSCYQQWRDRTSNGIYVDMAPSGGGFYTPEGIRGIDSQYIKRICSGDYSDQLAAEIMQNRHIHQTIKDNLLLNLNQYRYGVIIPHPSQCFLPLPESHYKYSSP